MIIFFLLFSTAKYESYPGSLEEVEEAVPIVKQYSVKVARHRLRAVSSAPKVSGDAARVSWRHLVVVVVVLVVLIVWE